MRTTESIMSATHASTLPVRNPRTGAIDDTLHVTPRAEIISAAAELRRAQRDWQALGIEGRSAALAELGRAFAAHSAALQAALAHEVYQGVVGLHMAGDGFAVEAKLDQCAGGAHGVRSVL